MVLDVDWVGIGLIDTQRSVSLPWKIARYLLTINMMDIYKYIVYIRLQNKVRESLTLDLLDLIGLRGIKTTSDMVLKRNN
jgi:hypothetical protein